LIFVEYNQERNNNNNSDMGSTFITLLSTGKLMAPTLWHNAIREVQNKKCEQLPLATIEFDAVLGTVHLVIGYLQNNTNIKGSSSLGRRHFNT
jgi:hypothetical protein